MKVVLDAEVCTGHGRCYALAPHAFAPDDLGHCQVVLVRPTGENEAAARLAVASCPEDALSVQE